MGMLLYEGGVEIVEYRIFSDGRLPHNKQQHKIDLRNIGVNV